MKTSEPHDDYDDDDHEGESKRERPGVEGKDCGTKLGLELIGIESLTLLIGSLYRE